jgi:hypothetical protein
MDQCSRHDTPPAFSVDLTNRSGHALRLELFALIVVVLTDQRFGDIISQKTTSDPIRLWESALRHHLLGEFPHFGDFGIPSTVEHVIRVVRGVNSRRARKGTLRCV